jgi:hypothetical protein
MSFTKRYQGGIYKMISEQELIAEEGNPGLWTEPTQSQLRRPMPDSVLRWSCPQTCSTCSTCSTMLLKKARKGQAWWQAPVVPVTQKAETERSLEPRCWGPAKKKERQQLDVIGTAIRRKVFNSKHRKDS